MSSQYDDLFTPARSSAPATPAPAPSSLRQPAGGSQYDDLFQPSTGPTRTAPVPPPSTPKTTPSSPPRPSGVQQIESLLGNLPGVKQAGDILRETWTRPIPVHADNILDRHLYTQAGFLVDEAGNVYDKNGHPVTSTNLQFLLTATLPAGPAPGAKAAQQLLQRVAPKIVPREGGLIQETQPVRGAVERGVQQLTGVPVKPAVSAAQSAAETARAARQGLSVLPQAGARFEGGPHQAPPPPRHETIGPPGSVLAIRPENVPQDLANGLYQLRTQAEADRVRIRQTARQVSQQAPEVHNESLYHFDENPSHPIEPREKALYDTYIKPLADESERIRLKLGKRGVNPDEYTPRFPIGRGNVVDRAIEGAKSAVGRGSVLSKGAPQFQHRRFKALIDEEGNRTLAYIKDGEVSAVKDRAYTKLGRFITKTEEQLMETEIRPIEQRLAQLSSQLQTLGTVKFGQQPAVVTRMTNELEGISEMLTNTARQYTTDIAGSLANRQRQLAHDLQMLAGPRTAVEQRVQKLGGAIADLNQMKDEVLERYNPLSASNKLFVDKAGRRYHIGEARTTEIEANTPVRYHKDVLVNRLLATAGLRRAERASDFLEAFKADPSFAKVAVRKGTVGQPEHFVPTALDQFRNFVFEPKVAAELDKYARVFKEGGGGPGLLEKVNDYLRSAIFFNPGIHIPNISVHWAVERGLLNALNPIGYKRLVTTGARAIKAISQQNDDYLYALDQGAAMKYAEVVNRDLHKWLIQKTAVDLSRNPSMTALLQQVYGIANPVKWLYNASNRATWFVNDFAILQRTYERMETHGEAFATAFHEVERGIPNYRIPGQIFGSRALSNIMSSPWTMFGNYHYGMLRAWGETARDLASRDPRTTVDALDRLAMAAVLGFVVYPKADAIVQRLTGVPTANVRRAGTLTMPELMYQFSRDELGLIDGVSRVVTPGVLPGTALQLAGVPYRTGDIYSGDLEAALRDPGAALPTVKQAVERAVAPVGFIDNLAAGGKTRDRALLRLVSVRASKNTPGDLRLNEFRPPSGTTHRARSLRVLRLYADGNTDAGQRLIRLHNAEAEKIYRQSLQEHHIVMSGPEVQNNLKPYLLKPPTPDAIEQYRHRDEALPTPVRHPSKAPRKKRSQ